MKLKKFDKKIDKALAAHYENTGEFMSDVEHAQTILDLVAARDEAGKDSSDVDALVNAAKNLVDADSRMDEDMAAFSEEVSNFTDALYG
mgnify:CR=1 FL=1